MQYGQRRGDGDGGAVQQSFTVAIAYSNQIAQYVKVLGAGRDAVVYMSLGQIQWVSPS